MSRVGSYTEAYRRFALAPRHPRELGALARNPGEYFDRALRAQGVVLSDCLPEERRAYRDRRAQFVRNCIAFATTRRAEWQHLQDTARAAHRWAASEAAAGRRVWGTPVPAAVLPSRPGASSATHAPRPRGAGRPAARVASRGADSGDSDGLDGESEPPSERGAA